MKINEKEMKNGSRYRLVAEDLATDDEKLDAAMRERCELDKEFCDGTFMLVRRMGS